MIEGCDYTKNVDKDICSILMRVRALAQVIKKYHDRGILLLDVKPENIWILPETLDLLMLFDFDSITSIEDLRLFPDLRLSFSEGYSAPELVKGNRRKISKVTDVYSIGAIVFEKKQKITLFPIDIF